MPQESVFPNEGERFPDEDRRLSPDEVAEKGPEAPIKAIYSEEDYKAARSQFEQLVTPAARATILDILVTYAEDELTVAEICEKTDRVSKATFARHKEPLLDFGVIEATGMKGNAMTYRANVYHPAVQLLVMLSSVIRSGKTQMFLDERFVQSRIEEDSL